MNEVLKALGMTKEKAISELESVIASDDDIDFFTRDEKMAMELAISALKDIEKVQIIVDAYFTRVRSKYEKNYANRKAYEQKVPVTWVEAVYVREVKRFVEGEV